MVCSDCRKLGIKTKDQAVEIDDLKDRLERQKTLNKTKLNQLRTHISELEDRVDAKSSCLTDYEEQLTAKDVAIYDHQLKIKSLEEQVDYLGDTQHARQQELRNVGKTFEQLELELAQLYEEVKRKDNRIVELSEELDYRDARIHDLTETVRERNQVLETKAKAMQIVFQHVQDYERRIGDLSEQLEVMGVPTEIHSKPLSSPVANDFDHLDLPTLSTAATTVNKDPKINAAVPGKAVAVVETETIQLPPVSEEQDKSVAGDGNMNTLNNRLAGMLKQVETLENRLVTMETNPDKWSEQYQNTTQESQEALTDDFQSTSGTPGILQQQSQPTGKKKKRVTFDLREIEHEAEVKHLKESLETAELAFAEVQDKNETLAGLVNDSQTEVDVLKNDVEELRLQSYQTEQLVGTMQVNLDAALAEAQRLQQDVASAKQDGKNNLLKAKARYQQQLKVQETIISDLKMLPASDVISPHPNIPDVLVVSEIVSESRGTEMDSLKVTVSSAQCSIIEPAMLASLEDSLSIQRAEMRSLETLYDRQCAQLDEQLQTHAGEIESSQNQLSDYREALTGRNREMIKLRSVLEHCETEITDLQRENRSLKQDLESAVRSNESLNQQIIDHDDVIDDLRRNDANNGEQYERTLNTLEELVHALEGELEASKREVAHLSVSSASVESNLIDYRLRTETSQTQNESLKAKVNVLERDNAELTNGLEKATSSLVESDQRNTAFAACIGALESSLQLQHSEFDKERGELSTELHALNEKLKIVNEQKLKLNEEISAFKTDLLEKKSTVDALNHEMRTLKSSIQAHREAANEADADWINMRQEILELKSVVETSEELVAVLEEDLKTARDESDQLKQKEINNQSAMNAFQFQHAELKADLDREITEYRLKTKAYEVKMRTMDGDHNSLLDALEQLEVENKGLVEHVQILEAHGGVLEEREGVLDAESEELKNIVFGLKSQLGSATKAVSSLEIDCARLKESEGAQTMELKELKLKFDLQNDQVQRWQEEVALAKQEKQALADEKMEIEHELKQLWDTEGNLKRSLALSESEKESVIAQLKVVEEQRVDVQHQNADYVAQLAQLTGEATLKDNDLQMVKDQLEALHQTSTDQAWQVASELRNFKESARTGEQAIMGISAELEEQKRKVVDLSDDKRQLKSEIDQLTLQLETSEAGYQQELRQAQLAYQELQESWNGLRAEVVKLEENLADQAKELDVEKLNASELGQAFRNLQESSAQVAEVKAAEIMELQAGLNSTGAANIQLSSTLVDLSTEVAQLRSSLDTKMMEDQRPCEKCDLMSEETAILVEQSAYFKSEAQRLKSSFDSVSTEWECEKLESANINAALRSRIEDIEVKLSDSLASADRQHTGLTESSEKMTSDERAKVEAEKENLNSDRQNLCLEIVQLNEMLVEAKQENDQYALLVDRLTLDNSVLNQQCPPSKSHSDVVVQRLSELPVADDRSATKAVLALPSELQLPGPSQVREEPSPVQTPTRQPKDQKELLLLKGKLKRAERQIEELEAILVSSRIDPSAAGQSSTTHPPSESSVLSTIVEESTNNGATVSSVSESRDSNESDMEKLSVMRQPSGDSITSATSATSSIDNRVRRLESENARLQENLVQREKECSNLVQLMTAEGTQSDRFKTLEAMLRERDELTAKWRMEAANAKETLELKLEELETLKQLLQKADSEMEELELEAAEKFEEFQLAFNQQNDDLIRLEGVEGQLERLKDDVAERERVIEELGELIHNERDEFEDHQKVLLEELEALQSRYSDVETHISNVEGTERPAPSVEANGEQPKSHSNSVATTTSVSTMTHDDASQTSELDTLKADLKDKKMMIDDLESTCEDLKQQLLWLQTQMDMAKKDTPDEVRLQQEQSMEASSSLFEKEEQVRQLQQERNDFENELNELKSELHRTRESFIELKTDQQSATHDWYAKKNALEDAFEEAQQLLKQREEELAACTTQVEFVQDRCRDLEAQLEQSQTDSDVKTQAEQHTIDSLIEARSTLQQELSDLTSVKDATDAKFNSLVTVFDDLKERSNADQLLLIEMQAQLEMNRISQVADDQPVRLQSAVKSMKNDLLDVKRAIAGDLENYGSSYEQFRVVVERLCEVVVTLDDTRNDLQSTVDSNASEARGYKDEVEVLTSYLERASTQLQSVMLERDDLLVEKDRCGVLEVQLEQLQVESKTQVIDRQQIIDSLTETVDVLQQELSVLQSLKKSTDDKLEPLMTEFNELKERSNADQLLLSEMQAQLELNRQHDDVTDQAVLLKNAVKSLKVDFFDLKHAVTDQLGYHADTSAQFRSEIRRLCDVCLIVDATKNELQSMLEGKSDELVQYEVQMEGLKNELENASAHLQSVMLERDSLVVEKVSVETEIVPTYVSAIQQWQAGFEHLQQQLQLVGDEKLKMAGTFEELMNRFHQVNDEKDEMKRLNEEVSAKVESLEDASTDQLKDIEELRMELDTKNTALIGVTEKELGVELELASAANKLEIEDAKIKMLEELKNQSQADFEEHQRKLVEMKDQYDEARLQLDIVTSQKDELDLKCSVDFEMLRGELKDKITTLNDVTEKLQVVELELASKVSELDIKNTTVQNLEDSLAQSTMSINQLKAEFKRLEDQHDQKLDKFRDDAKQLMEAGDIKHNELTGKLSILTGNYEDVSERLNKKSAEMDREAAENVELRSTLDSSKQQLDSVTLEKARLVQELDGLRAVIREHSVVREVEVVQQAASTALTALPPTEECGNCGAMQKDLQLAKMDRDILIVDQKATEMELEDEREIRKKLEWQTADLKADLVTKSKELDDAVTRVEERTEQQAKTCQAAQELEAKHRESLDAWMQRDQELSNKVNALGEIVATLKKQISDLEVQLEASNAEAKTAQLKLRSKVDEIDAAKLAFNESFETLQKQKLEESSATALMVLELQKLKRQLVETQGVADCRELELTRCESALSKKTTEHVQFLDQIGTLQWANECFQLDLSHLHEDYNQLEQDKAELVEKLKVSEAAISTHESNLFDLNGSRAEMQIELDDLGSSIGQLSQVEAELGDSERARLDLQTKYSAALTRLKAMDLCLEEGKAAKAAMMELAGKLSLVDIVDLQSSAPSDPDMMKHIGVQIDQLQLHRSRLQSALDFIGEAIDHELIQGDDPDGFAKCLEKTFNDIVTNANDSESKCQAYDANWQQVATVLQVSSMADVAEAVRMTVSELDAKNNVVSELTRHSDSLQQANKDLEAELEQLKVSMLKMEEGSSVVSGLIDQLDEQTKRNAELSEALEAKMIESSQLAVDLADKGGLVEKQTAQLEDLSKVNFDLIAMEQDTKKRFDDLADKSNRLEADAVDIGELVSVKDNLEGELKLKVTEIDRLRLEVTDAERRLNEETAKVASLTVSVDELKDKVDTVVDELTKAMANCDALTLEMADQKTSSAEADVKQLNLLMKQLEESEGHCRILEDKMDGLEMENKLLKERSLVVQDQSMLVDQQATQVKTLSNENAALIAKEHQMSEKLNVSQIELDELAKKCSRLEADAVNTDELVSVKCDVETELKLKTIEIDRLQLELADSLTRLSDESSRVAVLASNVEELGSRLAIAVDELTDATNCAETLKLQLVDLESLKAEVEEGLLNSLKISNDKFDEGEKNIKMLQFKISQLELDNEHLKERSLVQNDNLGQLRSEYDMVTSDNQLKMAQLETDLANRGVEIKQLHARYEPEVQRLLEQVGLLELEKQQLGDEIGSFQEVSTTEIEKVRESHRALVNDLATFAATVGLLPAETSSFDDLINQLSIRFSDLKQQAEESVRVEKVETERLRQSAQQALNVENDLNTRLLVADSSVQNLTEQLAIASGQNSTLKSKIDSLECEITEIKRNCFESNESSKEKILWFEGEVETLQFKLSEVQSLHDSQLKLTSASTTRHDALQQSYESLSRDNWKLTSENDKLLEQISSAVADGEHREANASQKMLELQHLKVENESLVNSEQSYLARISDLDRELKLLSGQNNDLLDAELEKLRIQLNEKDREVDVQNDEIMALRESVGRLKENGDRLESDNLQLRDATSESSSNVEKIQVLESQNEQLEEVAGSLRLKLDTASLKLAEVDVIEQERRNNHGLLEAAETRTMELKNKVSSLETSLLELASERDQLAGAVHSDYLRIQILEDEKRILLSQNAVSAKNNQNDVIISGMDESTSRIDLEDDDQDNESGFLLSDRISLQRLRLPASSMQLGKGTSIRRLLAPLRLPAYLRILLVIYFIAIHCVVTILWFNC